MAHKLRIAMLGHKRVPSREGGVEIVVEELSTRMTSRGHMVTLFNRSGHHVSGREFDSENRKDYKGVRMKYVPTLQRKGLAALTSSFFGALFSAVGRYDVVHVHAEGPCAFLWIPRLFGKRCVATIHGLDWNREKWKKGFGSKFIHYGERVAVRYAHTIIVLSEGVRDYFEKEYGRKTVLIPNGVCSPSIKAAEEIQNRWGLTKDSYILFLGRLVPEKGLRYLVEAYRAVDTDKKLVIAGGSSDTEDFVKELKTLAGDRKDILFTGFVSGNTLHELYSNCYIYCLPSDLEGMPLSLLEAMSYGNCCLVSDIEECASVVEDHAVLFRKTDSSDLRDQLQRLCDHPETVEQYKRNAAEFILGKYNWEDVVEKTLKEYKKHP